jgi:hypothetical protein
MDRPSRLMQRSSVPSASAGADDDEHLPRIQVVDPSRTTLSPKRLCTSSAGSAPSRHASPQRSLHPHLLTTYKRFCAQRPILFRRNL